MKIGLIVNPTAGVGAQLSWKGTDDTELAWTHIHKGAYQPVWDILNKSFEKINFENTEWYFGGNFKKISNDKFNYEGKIITNLEIPSTRTDTKEIAKLMINIPVDLIVFAGGDGTAADIASINTNIVMVGIPAGVKIFSPCFLHRPELLNTILNDWNGATKQVDLLDLDEDEYKKGNFTRKLVGSCNIPIIESIQVGKQSWSSSEDGPIFQSIIDLILDEKMLLDKTIIIGAGGTLHSIFNMIGIKTSLLGIDIMQDGKILILDATFEQINQFGGNIDEIWISPIGNQGHIFGRGNRQIPYKTINIVGKNGIRLFSTPEKVSFTEFLYSDTGNKECDKNLQGYYKIITGYHTSIVRKLIY